MADVSEARRIADAPLAPPVEWLAVLMNDGRSGMGERSFAAANSEGCLIRHLSPDSQPQPSLSKDTRATVGADASLT